MAFNLKRSCPEENSIVFKKTRPNDICSDAGESKYVRCADVYEAYLGCDKENCPDVSTVTLGRVPKTTNENAIL